MNANEIVMALRVHSQDIVAYKLGWEFAYSVDAAADLIESLQAQLAASQPENKPLVRCGECAKYQSPNCAAKHEQALMDFCSHGERKPERSEG